MGLALNSGSLLDFLLTLGKDELDVAGVGHVGVDLDSVSPFFPNNEGIRWNIHDREHGRYVCGPWEPG